MNKFSLFGGSQTLCHCENAAWYLVSSLQDWAWLRNVLAIKDCSHCIWSINYVLVSNGVLLNGKSHLLSILLSCPMTLNVGYSFLAWVYSCAELSFTYFLVLLQCLINIYKGLWHPVMKGAVQVFSSGIILLVKIQEESGGCQFVIQSEQWSHFVTLSRSRSPLFCNLPWERSVLWHVLLSIILNSPS